MCLIRARFVRSFFVSCDEETYFVPACLFRETKMRNSTKNGNLSVQKMYNNITILQSKIREGEEKWSSGDTSTFLSAPDSKFGAHRYEERVSVHLTSIRRVFPRFQSFGVAQPLFFHQKYRVTLPSVVKTINAFFLRDLKTRNALKKKQIPKIEYKRKSVVLNVYSIESFSCCYDCPR